MFDLIMQPLYIATSAVMLGCHWLLSKFLDPDGGAAWTLAIVGLTIAVRAITIPLFTKQIRSSRNMQLLAPQLKELQKRYAHDKQKLQEKTMELYKETGTNPFSSCFPLLIQIPIFIALFRLLADAAKTEGRKGHGLMTLEQAESFGNARLWGVGISDTFRAADGDTRVMLVVGVMVALMVASTFYMQKQLMTKNMPPEALTGQAAQIQKIMLYVLPIGFLISGFTFQLGLLVYMVVSNLWTLGQQFWLINANPTPGSDAFKAKQERDIRKGRTPLVDPTTEDAAADVVTEADPGGRVQPKRQSRKDRKQESQ